MHRVRVISQKKKIISSTTLNKQKKNENIAIMLIV